MSRIGTALQSIGPFGIGARLPFVMLPGGAAVALFAQIAREAGPAAASGAVVVTGLAVAVLAPVFTRLMRFFPPVVLGTMIVVVGVNLVKINAGLVSDTPAGRRRGRSRWSRSRWARSSSPIGSCPVA